MALKHYYIEDVGVDPMRKDKIASVRSIQFDLLPSGKIYVNIDQPFKGKVIQASVVITLDELRNAYEWLSGIEEIIK